MPDTGTSQVCARLINNLLRMCAPLLMAALEGLAVIINLTNDRDSKAIWPYKPFQQIYPPCAATHAVKMFLMFSH